MTTPTETTSIHVTRGAHGPVVRTRSGVVQARLLPVSGEAATVVLVAQGALLLGGDHVRIEVVVGAGCRLVLREVAATVAYDGRGEASSYDAEVTVADDGALDWRAEPLIVADGADVSRTLTVQLQPSSTLRLRETVVLGRHGERGGSARTRLRVRLAGDPVLVEDLDLTATSGDLDPTPLRALPGIAAGARVVDQVLAFGHPEPAETPGLAVLRLADGGWSARWVGPRTHSSPLREHLVT
ncbi:urease accessory protein UreD [Arsenicicoccus piscis]|uniref:Urease accessory protein UreD n=1 Tax=Arsenicicoccus piscis TaxID=673954 RepID=A0ABQ6HVH3_9MICO|nr:urease accessory protein UreD [Arsenicicoccus piscis]GMA19711.1 hypothetical protein GCM10025862_17320 [Arsenicicoccus piscis]GMA21977.1 hypothetical protein GCM10025862_39980 [Arsenicicoccus piscis]